MNAYMQLGIFHAIIYSIVKQGVRNSAPFSIHRAAATFIAAGMGFTLAQAPPARALVAVTVSEIGGNVVMSGSGSLNVAALTYQGGTGYTYGIDPDTATFLLNPGPFSSIYQGAFSFPGSLGPGTANVLPTSGSGDQFGIALYFNTPTLFVPGAVGYTGGAISSSSTYVGQTLATLGLTPGSYTWSWGSGATADSITMQIQAPPAPGPLPALGAAAALAWSRRLRRRCGAHRALPRTKPSERRPGF